MKKLLAMSILCIFLLSGCENIESNVEAQQPDSNGMFITIEENYYHYPLYNVVYHKDTKVMYTVTTGSYSSGIFTLLVNPDGSPMLYEGE